MFAEGWIFYGFQYCRYKNECEKSFENENGKMNYDVIMKKLQQITGLDMGLNASNLPEKFQRDLNQERRWSIDRARDQGHRNQMCIKAYGFSKNAGEGR